MGQSDSATVFRNFSEMSSQRSDTTIQRSTLRARFCFRLHLRLRLSRNRLVDFQVSHL